MTNYVESYHGSVFSGISPKIPRDVIGSFDARIIDEDSLQIRFDVHETDIIQFCAKNFGRFYSDEVLYLRGKAIGIHQLAHTHPTSRKLKQWMNDHNVTIDEVKKLDSSYTFYATPRQVAYTLRSTFCYLDSFANFLHTLNPDDELVGRVVNVLHMEHDKLRYGYFEPAPGMYSQIRFNVPGYTGDIEKLLYANDKASLGRQADTSLHITPYLKRSRVSSIVKDFALNHGIVVLNDYDYFKGRS